jgi:hypothetical protein
VTWSRTVVVNADAGGDEQAERPGDEIPISYFILFLPSE